MDSFVLDRMLYFPTRVLDNNIIINREKETNEGRKKGEKDTTLEG